MASRDWPPKRTRTKAKNLEIAGQRLGHTSLALGNIGRLVDDDGDSEVGKEYSAADHKGRAGNPSLSGDVLSVEDAAAFLERAARERMKVDPSMPYVQLINALARQQQ